MNTLHNTPKALEGCGYEKFPSLQFSVRNGPTQSQNLDPPMAGITIAFSIVKCHPWDHVYITSMVVGRYIVHTQCLRQGGGAGFLCLEVATWISAEIFKFTS